MAQNWNAWGASWGLSWDGYWGTAEVLPADTPDYGRAVNPNLKLRQIIDVKVSGTGAQIIVSGGPGDVRVEQERTESVREFGVGAVLRLQTGVGGVRAVTHQDACISGTGARLYAFPSGGSCAAGFGCAGTGSLIQIKGSPCRVAVGVAHTGTGNQLSISGGELDDVFAVKNPGDEELAVLAYQLYKLVA